MIILSIFFAYTIVSHTVPPICEDTNHCCKTTPSILSVYLSIMLVKYTQNKSMCTAIHVLCVTIVQENR